MFNKSNPYLVKNGNDNNDEKLFYPQQQPININNNQRYASPLQPKAPIASQANNNNYYYNPQQSVYNNSLQQQEFYAAQSPPQYFPQQSLPSSYQQDAPLVYTEVGSIEDDNVPSGLKYYKSSPSNSSYSNLLGSSQQQHPQQFYLSSPSNSFSSISPLQQQEAAASLSLANSYNFSNANNQVFQAQQSMYLDSQVTPQQQQQEQTFVKVPQQSRQAIGAQTYFPTQIKKIIETAFPHQSDVVCLGADDLKQSISLQLTSDAACHKVAPLLRNNALLKTIAIKGEKAQQLQKTCTISTHGWTMLADCMSNCSSLTIQQYKLQKEQIEVILSSIAINQSLTHLDLWDNQLDGEIAIFILEKLLVQNPQVTSVNLGENNIDPDDKLTIRRIITDHNIQVDYW